MRKRIRNYQENDYEACMALFNNVNGFRQSKAEKSDLDVWKKFNKNAFFNALSSPYSIVIEDGNNVYGFANLNKEGVIEFLIVGESYRNLKIGSGLLNKLEDKARMMNKSNILVECTPSSKDFFIRNNYMEIKLKTIIFGEDILSTYTLVKSL